MAQDTEEAAPASQTLPDSGPRALLATLRPQVYGKSSPSKVVDPIIEPLWVGVRSLAGVDAGRRRASSMRTASSSRASTTSSSRWSRSLQASGLVLDGFLTKPGDPGRPVAVGAWSDETPTMGSFIGLRQNRAVDTLKLRESALAARDLQHR